MFLLSSKVIYMYTHNNIFVLFVLYYSIIWQSLYINGLQLDSMKIKKGDTEITKSPRITKSMSENINSYYLALLQPENLCFKK